ncbi:MAG: hypothetical protein ACRCV6_09100 [Formosimonas sp.]
MSPTVQTLLLGLGVWLVAWLWQRARALKWFLPLWLAYCLYHMYVGVSGHGYSVAEELPFLWINFGMPAAVAVLMSWKCKKVEK